MNIKRINRHIIALICLLGSIPYHLSAQTAGNQSDWYISANTGASMAFGDDSYDIFKEFKEACGWNFNLAVGKDKGLWGWKVQAGVMKVSNRINLEAYEFHLLHNPDLVPNKGFYNYNAIQVTPQATFNLSQAFNAKRKTNYWNWYLFGGPGATLTLNYDEVVKPWKNEHVGYKVDDRAHLLWNVNFGTSLEYRLTPELGINAEATCSFTGDNMEGVVSEEFYDAIITCSLGVTYHF